MNTPSRIKSNQIIKAIADIDKVKIITSTMKGNPKTIIEIVKETNIPMVSCYRKVEHLLESKILIQKESKYLPDGKKVKTYSCIYKQLKLSFKKGILKISVSEK